MKSFEDLWPSALERAQRYVQEGLAIVTPSGVTNKITKADDSGIWRLSDHRQSYEAKKITRNSLKKAYEQRQRGERVTGFYILQHMLTEFFIDEDPSPPPGVKRPKRTQETTTVYQRDKAVVDWVKTEASGQCELCGEDAPFEDESGVPFLEVHHVKPLAEEGTDSPSNAVAVCPNCHRALHYSVDRDELRADLYEQVERLVRE